MGQCRELGAQHLMRAERRHLLFEFVCAVDPACLHIADDVVVNMLEIAELLVEVTRQQQCGVVEFALGDLERARAELPSEVGGTERDRDDERGGAQDEPLDRAQPYQRQRADDRLPQAPRGEFVR